MFKQVHIHFVTLLTALGAGITEAAGILPDTGDISISVALLAISGGITAAVSVYNTNKE